MAEVILTLLSPTDNVRWKRTRKGTYETSEHIVTSIVIEFIWREDLTEML